MTALVPWISPLSSLSTAWTPPDCPERLQRVEEVQAALAALLAPWMPALGSPSAVYVVTSCFPGKKRNKYPNSSFTKMEFCCERKMLP